MTGEWTDGFPEEPGDAGDAGAGADPSAQAELFAHIYGHSDADAEPEVHDAYDPAGDDAVDADNLDAGYDPAEGPAEIENGDHDAGEWPGLTEDADPAPYLVESSTQDGAEPAFQESPDPAVIAGQEWANAIGAGAVDPSGELPATLGGFDFHDPSTVAYGIRPGDTDPGDTHSNGSGPDMDPDRPTVSDLDTQHWTQSGLLDGLDSLRASSTDGGGQELDGPAGVQALWARLAPGQSMPTTDAGSPDLTAALDQLAARAGSSLLDVIDAARRLVG